MDSRDQRSAQWLHDHEVIIASHRGPIEHELTRDGRLITRSGSGGLASALGAAALKVPFCWVAAAMTEGDEMAARQGARATGAAGAVVVHYATLPRAVYHAHYHVFSNRFLWFLQHGLRNRLRLPAVQLQEAWRSGYRPANVAFASAVACSAQTAAPTVLVQDYHLYLTPRAIRQRLPGAMILHFCHIPWPEPAAWEAVPAGILGEILRGMLGADIVGFQDQHSVENFLGTCRAYLHGTRVNPSRRLVWHESREITVGAYPISVDPGALRADLTSPAVRGYREELAPRCGEITLVRVDRLDPTKNIPLGFRAFGRLLERRPDLVGRVRFLAFLVPSRTDLPEYQEEHADVWSSMGEVNQRFGRPGYQPVEILYESNRLKALAAMSLADVMLVNSLADGMNLVAKEAPIVSQKDAALVLSTRCGAWAELGAAALGIEPESLEDTAAALEAAIAMPQEERAARAAELRRRIESHDILDWFDLQCSALAALERGRSQAQAIGSRQQA